MTDMNDSLPKEIGSVLRHRREELHLTLDEVAQQTKIRKSYILALEEENFHELPGKVYVVGFLRNYAGLLGISAEPLLEALGDILGTAKKGEPGISELRAQTSFFAKSSSLKTWLWVAVALVILTAAGIYFFSDLFDAERLATKVSTISDSQTENSQKNSVASNGAGVVTSKDAAESVMSQQTRAADDLPLTIPPGGGTLELVVEGSGKFLISIDGDSPREYQAQPGLTLSWPVQEMVDLSLDVDGKVLLQLNDQKYAVTGKRHLLLQSKQKPGD